MVAITNNQSALATPAVKASKPGASRRKGRVRFVRQESDDDIVHGVRWFGNYGFRFLFKRKLDSDTSGTFSAKEVKTISLFQNNLTSLWTLSPVNIQILFCCANIWYSKSYCQLAKLQISKTNGIPKCPTNVQNIWINVFTSFAFIDALTQRYWSKHIIALGGMLTFLIIRCGTCVSFTNNF